MAFPRQQLLGDRLDIKNEMEVAGLNKMNVTVNSAFGLHVNLVLVHQIKDLHKVLALIRPS